MPAPAASDTILAARTIRSHSILSASDVIVEKNKLIGPISKLSDVVGLEAKFVLYEGRPISANDIGPAAIIERNQIVALVYLQGTLSITVEARALGRGGVGERLRVMNLSSRHSVQGIVAENGDVVVGDLSSLAMN